MRKIVIEPIDNGLLKTIVDTNYDGAGKKYVKKNIYLLKENCVHDTELFLKDLIEDLGLYLGNDYDKDVLSINKIPGNKYQMNSNELIEERKKLTVKLNELKQLAQLTK
jgi:hypothetical protein